MSEIFATNHFSNIGIPDKTRQRRKRFLKEVQDPDGYGAHSSEMGQYWKYAKNWRNLLVTIPKVDMKKIFVEYLDINILKTSNAKDIDDAFERIYPYISSVSKRALVDFFEKQDVVHKAIGALKRTKPNYGLTTHILAQDILLWETKLFKTTKCPPSYWLENRIELMEIPCEDDDHRWDCKQYHQDGVTEWLDRETIISRKIGLQRKNFMADQAKLKELKFKAIANLIIALKKEPDYSYDKLTETLTSIEWSHPEIYLKPDLQELWKFTTEEKAFCEEYFEIYDIQVTEQGVMHSLKETERVY